MGVSLELVIMGAYFPLLYKTMLAPLHVISDNY